MSSKVFLDQGDQRGEIMILLSHQHLPLDHLEISAHIHAYINLAYNRALLLHNETVIVISAELVNHTISFTYKSD